MAKETAPRAHPPRADKLRASKREKVLQFFLDRPGQALASPWLHQLFGPSFRTRVSEINRDPESPIRVVNRTDLRGNGEHSVYWSEPRPKADAPRAHKQPTIQRGLF